MDANLQTNPKTSLASGIKRWRESKYPDFKTELPNLYKSLVTAWQDVAQRDEITEFLSEKPSNKMDSCIRWHLLDIAAKNTENEKLEGTAKAHLELAKTIITCDGLPANVLFYTPNKPEFCKKCAVPRDATAPPPQSQLGSETKASHKRANTGVMPTELNKTMSKYTTTCPSLLANVAPSGHFRTSDNKPPTTLFIEALCAGHHNLDTLVNEAKKLVDTQPQGLKGRVTITGLARRNANTLRDGLKDPRNKVLPALEKVLKVVPNFLRDTDGDLFKGIIDKQLLGIADVILKSPNGNLLASKAYAVQALINWKGDVKPSQTQGKEENGDHNAAGDTDEKGDKDEEDEEDKNDKNAEDEGDEQRQDLACSVLKHAPETVLRSPEVLRLLMWHNLLDSVKIREAYEDNVNRKSEVFTFASYLSNVSGILHMAVYYQQQQLVEKLLRLPPPSLSSNSLPQTPSSQAVARSYVRLSSIAGDTVPKENEAKTLSVATVRDTKGSAAKDNGRLTKDKRADSGCYPLWFNNETVKVGGTRVKDDGKWKRIRSALIYSVMVHAENVQTLLTIMRESGEPENEINFDMSRLMIEGTSVADLVTSLPRRGRSHDLIRYEETIRYADFPMLDISTQTHPSPDQSQQRSYRSHTHREVLDILEWLYDHGVRRIITLRVPDRMTFPHDELEIASVVKRFHVEVLDWRILDLSLSIFKPYGEPGEIPLICSTDDAEEATDDKTYLRTLYLYTGGRRSALDHWFGSEGLVSMKNLKNVEIRVIKELTTRKQSDAIVKHIREKIKELKEKRKSMQIEVQAELWKSQSETPRLQEIIHHLSPRLAQFITYYRKTSYDLHVKRQFKPTKVAIIDNGVLSIDPVQGPSDGKHAHNPSETRRVPNKANNKNASRVANMADQHLDSDDFFNAEGLLWRICDGTSFVRETDRLSPWYLASNPHGTQMANLLCAIDPLCQLFVAKIADGRYGYSASRAAEAVKWAIEKDVDIISMSFTTTEESKEFKDAVYKATEKGIIIVCSHHDEGARSTKNVYPARYGDEAQSTILRMACCDMYGKLLYDWDESTTDEASTKNRQFDLCISSQNIAVGSIPFIASSAELISGSSVATAIAAGVCSLLIACLRILKVMHVDNKEDNSQRNQEIEFVKMRHNVGLALNPENNRAQYAYVKAFLKKMAPSTTNDKFISLDRFARLDELRDVNSGSLAQALISLGANLTPG